MVAHYDKPQRCDGLADPAAPLRIMDEREPSDKAQIRAGAHPCADPVGYPRSVESTRPVIASAATSLIDEGYGLYLVSRRTVLDHIDSTPFGLPVTPVDFLAPRDLPWDARSFIRVYNRLNLVLFGSKGIALDCWVMIDLGFLPSAFLLIALPRELLVRMPQDSRLTPKQQALLREQIPPLLAEADHLGFHGPIPVAGYCAAPTPVSGHWVGWSLCSAIPKLGTIVKGLALEAYGATTLTGVTQYGNPALRLHRKFGPMRILSAYLDLHPLPHTFVYQTDVYAHDREQTPTFLMRCDDTNRQHELQAKIDASSHTVHILPPGLDRDGWVPILETT